MMLNSINQSPQLRATLLGKVCLIAGQRVLGPELWSRRAARELLLLLLVTPGHRCPRERVLDVLWPEIPPNRSRTICYQNLHVLRRVLEPALPSRRPSSYVTLTLDTIGLHADLNLWVDADAFEAAVCEAERSPPMERRARLRAAVALYGGDLLQDEPACDWATARREQLRHTWQRAAVALAALDLEAGEPLASVTTLEAILIGQATAEDVHQALIRAYVAAGDQGRALRQYELCRQALQDELGIEPSATTQELVAPLRSRLCSTMPSLGSEVPWLRQRPLPAPPTPLIGRDCEIATLLDLLWHPNVRLVTLTGPGGVGKSRLAIEVAVRLEADFADGVAFVPLATVATPDAIPGAIATAFGIWTPPSDALMDRLTAALARRRLLLLLDNFEHVIGGATVVADLLAACPHLKVLATSRAPLQLQGEHVLDVPPLALPPKRRPTLQSLLRSDAGALFVQRARAAHTGFTPTEQDAAIITRICQRLDGLPLAIELAATRIRVLSPRALLARLEQAMGTMSAHDIALDLIAAGSRDLPPRLRSLRQAIAWSYDLLTPEEQALFRRLAVFADGFTLEAADAVAGQEEEGGRDPSLVSSSVLDRLASLVDKSLVRREGGDGRDRFGMLETIRLFALEQLEASEDALAARDRHADWCLKLAEDGHPDHFSPRSSIWFARLDSEIANVRAALAWVIGHGDAERALRLASALWWFWRLQGQPSEGLHWLNRALTISASVAPPLRARAMVVAGDLAWIQGDLKSASALIADAIELWEEIGDERSATKAQLVEGYIALVRGDDDRAGVCFSRVIEMLDAREDASIIAMATINLGLLALRRGAFARAQELLELALDQCRATGFAWGIGKALEYLGDVARTTGDCCRAARLYHESLATFQAERDLWGIGSGLHNIALLATKHNRPEAATRLFGKAAVAYERLGIRSLMLPPVRSELEAALQHLQRSLGQATFNSLWQDGTDLPLERAVAKALTVAEEIASVAIQAPVTN